MEKVLWDEYNRILASTCLSEDSPLKEIKAKAESMYQEFLKSGKKVWDEACEKFPDHNGSEAPNAADFIMAGMQGFIDSKKLGSVRGEVFHLLHGKVLEGLT